MAQNDVETLRAFVDGLARSDCQKKIDLVLLSEM
jgi:hypothetical protein